VGIYGILTFMVTHRRREIGIRLALGAEPTAMLRMIIREGVGLAVIGCVLGVVGAFVAGRSLESFLFSIQVWDPATFGAVLFVVLGVATAACIVPGRRAAAEDPVSALRAAYESNSALPETRYQVPVRLPSCPELTGNWVGKRESDAGLLITRCSQLLNTKYTAPTKHSPAHMKSVLIGCFMYNTANGTNTIRVITSCITLSWARLNVVAPIRFAGT